MDCTRATRLGKRPGETSLRPAGTVEPAWWAMVRIEPRLYAVTALAASLREAGGGWPEWERVKRKLQTLVGWYAADRRLATEAHYDAAYKTALDVFEGVR